MALTRQDLSAIDKLLNRRLGEQDKRLDKKLSVFENRFTKTLVALRKQIHGDVTATLSIALTAVDKRIDQLEKQIQS